MWTSNDIVTSHIFCVMFYVECCKQLVGDCWKLVLALGCGWLTELIGKYILRNTFWKIHFEKYILRNTIGWKLLKAGAGVGCGWLSELIGKVPFGDFPPWCTFRSTAAAFCLKNKSTLALKKLWFKALKLHLASKTGPLWVWKHYNFKPWSSPWRHSWQQRRP